MQLYKYIRSILSRNVWYRHTLIFQLLPRITNNLCTSSGDYTFIFIWIEVPIVIGVVIIEKKHPLESASKRSRVVPNERPQIPSRLNTIFNFYCIAVLHNSWTSVSTRKHRETKIVLQLLNKSHKSIKTELSRRNMEVTEEALRMQINMTRKSRILIYSVNGASWVQGWNSETAPPIQMSWNRSIFITFTSLQPKDCFSACSALTRK